MPVFQLSLLARRGLLAALTCVAVNTCAAADFRPIPLHESDHVSAVDTDSLRFNASGLLTSVRRSAVVGQSGWKPEDAQRAAYVLEREVIDCGTGYALSAGASLVGKDGKVIATRASDSGRWSEELSERARMNLSRHWPVADLALVPCALASHPMAQELKRARAAREPVLLANRSATARDRNEIITLVDAAASPLRIDYARLAAGSSANPVELLGAMQLLHAQWRTGFNRAHRASQPGALSAPLLATINGDLAEYGIVLTQVQGYQVDVDYDDNRQPPATVERRKIEAMKSQARVDCQSGLWVPLRRTWFDEKGVVLSEQRLNTQEALADVRRALVPDNDMSLKFNRAMHAPDPVALACHHMFARLNAAAERNPDLLAPGVSSQDLLRARSPDALLLAIRAAATPENMP